MYQQQHYIPHDGVSPPPLMIPQRGSSPAAHPMANMVQGYYIYGNNIPFQMVHPNQMAVNGQQCYMPVMYAPPAVISAASSQCVSPVNTPSDAGRIEGSRSSNYGAVPRLNKQRTNRVKPKAGV